MNLPKLFAYYIIVLVAYLPWQNFFTAILNKRITDERILFWFIHWYEPFLVIFVILGLICSYRRSNSLSRTMISTIVFVVYLIIHIINNSSFALEGIRFGYLGFWILIAIYFIGLSGKYLKTIISILFITALINASIALFEQFLHPFYWEDWGLITQFNHFGYGKFALARDDVNILQSAALIGGPNKLAQYLLLAFVLLLFSKQTQWQKYRKILLSLFLLAIIVTISRSTILATCLVLIVYFKIDGKKFKKWYSTLTVAILIAVVIAWQGIGGYLPTFFERPGSDDIRQQKIILSVEILKERLNRPSELIFGSGLGSAGPLSMKYDKGIVSENWFLQIALEIGLLGLVLYLIFIYFLGKDLLFIFKKNTARAVLVAFGALLVVSLFLHPFADNPAVNITLFIIIGILTQYFSVVQNKPKINLGINWLNRYN